MNELLSTSLALLWKFPNVLNAYDADLSGRKNLELFLSLEADVDQPVKVHVYRSAVNKKEFRTKIIVFGDASSLLPLAEQKQKIPWFPTNYCVLESWYIGRRMNHHLPSDVTSKAASTRRFKFWNTHIHSSHIDHFLCFTLLWSFPNLDCYNLL